MTIRYLKVVSIPVSDQDRAKAFYSGTLGFEIVSDNPMGPDQRWVELCPKGAETSITLVTWFESMPAGSATGLVLDSDDVRTDHEALKAQGVVFDEELKQDSWGTWPRSRIPTGTAGSSHRTSSNRPRAPHRDPGTRAASPGGSGRSFRGPARARVMLVR